MLCNAILIYFPVYLSQTQKDEEKATLLRWQEKAKHKMYDTWCCIEQKAMLNRVQLQVTGTSVWDLHS